MKGPTLKNRDEIAIMDRANRVVVEILEKMREMVRPGATTAQLNAMAEEELAKRGAKSPFKGYAPMGLPPYPAVVCTSVNDVIVHGIPNRAKLQEGDIIGLDFGSILDGFVGDAAITVPIGKVTPAAEKLMATTRECLELAIEEMRPGRHIGDIGAAVQEHAESRGYHVIRTFVGHGIGRRMHEDPQVYNYGRRGRGIELREGMVLAIEPMLCEIGAKLRSRIERSGTNGVIQDVKTDADGWTARTVDGTLAAHFENSVAVTANGPLVLGKA
ncbi:MAG: type I methionyl aminopeptidase [Acidobacteria bacterium]|nr:type I methionyl aminopeptidase [Acidobacteriota bacterium]MBV9475559.1 type I methionyl aminopeptidase [Acidobacteriota bacterium]